MSSDLALLRDLFVAYPVRSVVLSVGPLVLAAAQGVNAFVHGVSLPAIGLFVLCMIAFAVLATRLSLATFRTETLEATMFDEQKTE